MPVSTTSAPVYVHRQNNKNKRASCSSRRRDRKYNCRMPARRVPDTECAAPRYNAGVAVALINGATVTSRVSIIRVDGTHSGETVRRSRATRQKQSGTQMGSKDGSWERDDPCGHKYEVCSEHLPRQCESSSFGLMSCRCRALGRPVIIRQRRGGRCL
jgi:hypothetical protein